MSTTARIGHHRIGEGQPVFIVAEVSGNHNGDLGRAAAIVDAAAEAGADAIKLQHYTPESLTLDAPQPWFRIEGNGPWGGRTLHDLYAEAMTPWEWTEPLFERARGHGLAAFSTPFDQDAIDLLEQFDPPAHKVASFELVDHQLLSALGRTGRPIIASTGLADAHEIDAAVRTLRENGAGDIVLLHCNSTYPADPAQLDLRTIPDMRRRWDVPVGLSDHTMTDTSVLVAVALGACVVEKHLTISRADGGPDAGFSLEPREFSGMVAAIREAEATLGTVRYGPSESEAASLAFRRSLFFTRDVPAGSIVGPGDVRALRPGTGLPPSQLADVLGSTTRVDVTRGTPVAWDLLERRDDPRPV